MGCFCFCWISSWLINFLLDGTLDFIFIFLLENFFQLGRLWWFDKIFYLYTHKFHEIIIQIIFLKFNFSWKFIMFGKYVLKKLNVIKIHYGKFFMVHEGVWHALEYHLTLVLVWLLFDLMGLKFIQSLIFLSTFWSP